MTTDRFHADLDKLIDGFDATSHRLITAWHDAAERFGDAARQRWDAAFEESRAQLSAQTRKNAAHARRVFAGYYSQGVELSTAGAAVAVDTLVKAARTAAGRASQWRQSRA